METLLQILNRLVETLNVKDDDYVHITHKIKKEDVKLHLLFLFYPKRFLDLNSIYLTSTNAKYLLFSSYDHP